MRRRILKICVSIGKTDCLQQNNKTQAAVFGPMPFSESKKWRASSIETVFKKDKSRFPRRVKMSFKMFLMTTDLTLARPPDFIAAAMLAGRARLARSQSGKRAFKLANALWLFMLVVDWERIVLMSSSSGSSWLSLRGTP